MEGDRQDCTVPSSQRCCSLVLVAGRGTPNALVSPAYETCYQHDPVGMIFATPGSYIVRTRDCANLALVGCRAKTWTTKFETTNRMVVLWRVLWPIRGIPPGH
jgi:hypothetical protein